jgi:hypothetical protein
MRISEAELIEIAQRFRHMEEAAQIIDVYAAHAAQSGFAGKLLENDINDERGAFEIALELCRDDMVTMQEALRK